jgi:hypothetical protein
LAGLYWNDAVMQPHRFIYKQGKLLLDDSEGIYELRPLGNDAFRLMEAPRRYIFTFVRRAGSFVVSVDHEGSPVSEYRRVADTKPNAAALRAFEGQYYSPELDVCGGGDCAYRGSGME